MPDLAYIVQKCIALVTRSRAILGNGSAFGTNIWNLAVQIRFLAGLPEQEIAVILGSGASSVTEL